MPRIILKETITKEIEIPMDKLCELIDHFKPFTPILKNRTLEPKHRLIYSFRIDIRLPLKMSFLRKQESRIP